MNTVALISALQWSISIKTVLLIFVCTMFLLVVTLLVIESIGKKRKRIPFADILSFPIEQTLESEEQPEPINEIILDSAEMDAEEKKQSETIIIGGKQLFVRYNRSFLARLSQSDDESKGRYVAIRDFLLSYGLKSRMSWQNETFRINKVTYAKFGIKGKTLSVYLALDPQNYENSKYFAENLSDVKQYEAVPLRMKLRSDRSVKWAMELIEEMMEQNGYTASPIQEQSFAPVYETTEKLVNQGLIKLCINDENGKTVDMPDVSFQAVRREKNPTINV